MSLYGDLYTNLTTFFHKFRFKGGADNNKHFPTNPLGNADVIDATPEVAYSVLSLGTGNRWIKMQEENNTINIYHAAPEGKDDDSAAEVDNTIRFSNTEQEDAVSVASGGYLTVYNNTFDEAGHLTQSSEKCLQFPDYSGLTDRVSTAENDIDNLQLQMATANAEIDGLQAQLAPDGDLMTRLGTAVNNAQTAIETVGELTKDGGDIPTMSSKITTLERTVNNSTTGVAALNTAVGNINDSLGDVDTAGSLWYYIDDHQDQLYNGTKNRMTEIGNAMVEVLAILQSLISTLSEIQGSKDLYLNALNDAKAAAANAGWTTQNGVG